MYLAVRIQPAIYVNILLIRIRKTTFACPSSDEAYFPSDASPDQSRVTATDSPARVTILA